MLQARTTASKSTPKEPQLSKVKPPSLSFSPAMLSVHRKSSCACGGGCPSCDEKTKIQPKLKVGTVSDRYEQEADRIADQVMRTPEMGQRQPVTTTETPVEQAFQPKPLSHPTCSSETQTDLHPLIQSQGNPLPDQLRTFMESRFHHDFSQVKIHTDSQAEKSAQAMNARAFTVGQHVVFGRNQYSPHTAAGKKLVAHELTHTIQQQKTTIQSIGQTPPTIQRVAVEGEEEGKSNSCEGTSRHGPGEFRTLRNDTTAKIWEISNFDISENFLKPEHKKLIKEKILTPSIIDLVKKEDWLLWVNGNASTTADDEYNKLLSKLRAICTTLFLDSEGMSIGKSKVTGTGEAGARVRLRKSGSPKIDEVEAAEDRTVQISIFSTKAPPKIEPIPEPECPDQGDLEYMFNELEKNCGILLISEVFLTDLACGVAVSPFACVRLKAAGLASKGVKEFADKCCTLVPDQQVAKKLERQLDNCIMSFMVIRVPELWPDCNSSKSSIERALEL